jgi:uncharacterized SAM-binding protein YcdF (DUF218 family)
LNSLFELLGLSAWKPILTALLLPPVPLLVTTLMSARMIRARRHFGWPLLLISLVLLWMSCCTISAQLLTRYVLHPPAALSAERIAELKAQNKQPIAIVVLGSGLEPYAPEYGVGNLSATSVERLRYGIWLSRQTGLRLGFSGGVGWAQPDAVPEARLAGRIAAEEFGLPLTWMEDSSRDTRQNAGHSIALLHAAGIRHIVLVTNGWHMPRALDDFEAAAAGQNIRIEPAPMGMARTADLPLLMWLPSGPGMLDVQRALHEILGRLAGA